MLATWDPMQHGLQRDVMLCSVLESLAYLYASVLPVAGCILWHPVINGS